MALHSFRFSACLALAISHGIYLENPAPAIAVQKSWNTGGGNWSTAGHWSPNGVPTGVDTAALGNLPAVANSLVLLDQTDIVAGLSITDGMTLLTNGFSLVVTGDTVVSGRNIVGNPSPTYNSTLTVTRNVGAYDLDTDNLFVSDYARVVLLGGIMEVDEVMSIDSTSALFGGGLLRLKGNVNPRSLVVDGSLHPGAEGLTIDQLGSGRVDLDGTFGSSSLSLTGSIGDGSAFSSLTVNGDALADTFDGTIDMVPGAAITMNLTDGWGTGPGSQLNLLGSSVIGAGPSTLNGNHVTLGGSILASSSSSNGRINANSTLADTVHVDLNQGSRLAFYGATTIGGGTYDVGNDAALSFQGPTTVTGGTFNVAASSGGNVHGPLSFQGATTWAGTVVVNGIASQSGNASVNSSAFISATTFDMDGPFGSTEWTINAPLTVAAQSIDSGQAFDGTMNIGPSLLSNLSMQLGGGVWNMDGTLNLIGNAAFNVNRISGSPMTIHGSINVNSKVGISSQAAFSPTSQVNFVSATSELTMQSQSHVSAGAEFQGAGTLIVGNSGAMVLGDNAQVNVDVLNRGIVVIGDGPGIATVKRWQQSSTGSLQMEISGNTPAVQYDRLIATANVDIQGGTLDILVNPSGGSYSDPVIQGSFDDFLVIETTFLTGRFDNLKYAGALLTPTFVGADAVRSHQGGGLFRIAQYGSEELHFVNYRALAGDANGDGTVDGIDFTIWNANKFTNGTDWITGDFNGDGLTDGQDFTLWNSNKFTSVGNFALTAVPEPTAAVLGTAIVCWIGLERRRASKTQRDTRSRVARSRACMRN